jgi:AcrR family transcriptional regulator
MPKSARSDVLRNRERILTAASACFNTAGADCHLATVATEAGVGAATMFRHFPTKKDLVEAVLLRCLEESESAVVTAENDSDALSALLGLLEHFVQSLTRDRGLKRIAEDLLQRPEIQARQQAILASTETLLRRCQTIGTVRTDVQLTDLMILTEGIAYAAPPEGWQRALDLALRGFLTAQASGDPGFPSSPR